MAKAPSLSSSIFTSPVVAIKIIVVSMIRSPLGDFLKLEIPPIFHDLQLGLGVDPVMGCFEGDCLVF